MLMSGILRHTETDLRQPDHEKMLGRDAQKSNIEAAFALC